MISLAAVLRDLHAGRAVHRNMAPEAVASLVAAGTIRLHRGWARFTAPQTEARRREAALQRERVEEPHAKARERADRIHERLRIGPATARDLAAVGRCGNERARQLARECGARLQYADDEQGRTVTYWALPGGAK